MSTVNLSEFYYKTCEKLGKSIADLRYHQTRRTKLTIIETDEELGKHAGMEKCKFRGRLSLADCYALAIAKSMKAKILTTDRELANTGEAEAILLKP